MSNHRMSIALLLPTALLLLADPPQARIVGTANEDSAIGAWYANLMQPDNPSMSCCGEGDAYWADEVHYENGEMYAVITDDRPDEFRIGPDTVVKRAHEETGTKYIIPPAKITRKDGNPTGHVILFLGAPIRDQNRNLIHQRAVLCYVMNGGV